MGEKEEANKMKLKRSITLPQVQVLGLCLLSISMARANLSTDTANRSQQELMAKLAGSQVYDDPFAVTFEDFLKEASRISAPAKESSPDAGAAAAAAAGVVVEEEPAPIDYIFPPASKHQQQELQHEATGSGKQASAHKRPEEAAASGLALLNQIQAMFAWDQLLTHKCSRPCGKGRRVFHLSCIDLKYRVRVEDELCLRANLARPKELSEQFCNEIDCQPEWVSLEFQECSPEFNEDGSCRRNLYKREQCVLVNAAGLQVSLDESRCNRIAPSTTTPGNHSQQAPAEVAPLDPSSDYSFEEIEKNNILANHHQQASSSFLQDSSAYAYAELPTATADLAGSGKGAARHNEPFFHVGPWSECSGAPVNKLGKRTREVTCRLYLSRSSKLTDLPDSSCRGLATPDREEPCYMDSGPLTAVADESSAALNSSSDSDAGSPSYYGDSLDETVYDTELARYVWRKEGFTRCSAECLGGQKESLIECWDKVAGAVVSQTLCEPQAKPIPTIEECNNIPCPLEWKEGPFSRCTRPCGSAGVRTRPVACVRKYSHQPAYETFAEEECRQLKEPMPHKLESCNRFDCRPEWNVGPWSECSKKCGEGVRTRPVVCVQEFAGRDRPLSASKETNAELLEAMLISANNWHPGKVTQIPFTECYEEYRTVPALEEKCFDRCPSDAPYIDSDPHQDYRMTREGLRKKSVSLKIGGRVRLVEGKTLKIRCKVHQGQTPLIGAGGQPDKLTEWFKDGVRIFLNDSRIADKQYDLDDNLIMANDIYSSSLTDDQPTLADHHSTSARSDSSLMAADYHSTTSARPKPNSARTRTLHVRSWPHYLDSDDTSQKSFYFVQNIREGRFILVGENTLKIKRIRLDDSGTYTCTNGALKESIEVKVIRRSDLFREAADVVYN